VFEIVVSIADSFVRNPEQMSGLLLFSRTGAFLATGLSE
jgi:hypothetical protein